MARGQSAAVLASIRAVNVPPIPPEVGYETYVKITFPCRLRQTVNAAF